MSEAKLKQAQAAAAALCVTFPTTRDHPVEWMPIGQLNSGKGEALFGPQSGRLSGNDVKQGNFPDCFVVASMIAVAQSHADNLLRELYVGSFDVGCDDVGKGQGTSSVDGKQSKNEAAAKKESKSNETKELSAADQENFHTFRFFRDGRWKSVTVDTLVPCFKRTGRPAMCSSPDGRRWLMLLEKAYAASYGSFEAICGGNCSEVLYDFTGQPCEMISLDVGSTDELALATRQSQLLKLLAIFEAAVEGRPEVAVVIGTRSVFDKNGAERAKQAGVQIGHAYVVTNMVGNHGDNSTDFLFRLMNPHRDTSVSALQLSKETAKKWSAAIAAMSPLKPEIGEGFMTLADVCLMCNSISVCHLSPQQRLLKMPTHLEHVVEWRASTAGGNTALPTWRKNPKYVVRLDWARARSDTVALHIVVGQADQRHNKAASTRINYLATSLTAVVPHHGTEHVPTPYVTQGCYDTLLKTIHWNKREMFATLPLHRTTGPETFLLIPSIYDEGAEGQAQMHIYSAEDPGVVEVEPLDSIVRRWKTVPRESVAVPVPCDHATTSAVFGLKMPTDGLLHVLVRLASPTQHPQPASTTNQKLKKITAPTNPAYIGMTVLTGSTDNPGSVAGGIRTKVTPINYKEISAVVPAKKGETLTVALHCPKSTGKTVKVHLEGLLQPGASNELRGADEPESESSDVRFTKVSRDETRGGGEGEKETQTSTSAGVTGRRSSRGSSGPSHKAPTKPAGKPSAKASLSMGTAAKNIKGLAMDYANL